MLLEAQQHHFSAFVVKDHYCPTMLSAYIAEKYVGDGSCRVFGGIALNNSVGGINLKAVDAAVAIGAKLVWMPTVSALRHKIMHSSKGVAFPANKGMSVAEKPIMYLQEDGSLQPQVLEVLDYLAAHPDVILATGHGSRDEIDALIHAAVERGVQRILVNHPHYMIGASLEDMVAWSRLGAYIELNARGLCAGFQVPLQRDRGGPEHRGRRGSGQDRGGLRLWPERQRQPRGGPAALHLHAAGGLAASPRSRWRS